MPAAGERISEYVLQRPLGQGGFAQVWLARHHVWSDQWVAIKFPTDLNALRNLQTEGTALAELAHPNIVRALGFDPFAQQPYLVMEYVPGQNLRQALAAGALPPPQVLRIMRQILTGLAYAHQRHMLHLDLKPENILLHAAGAQGGYESPGTVKIADFGLGRIVRQTDNQSIAFSVPGDVAAGGTPDYMPPEQRSASAAAQLDARADVYACGVILFEMLTGEKPAGTDLPSQVNPAIPAALDELFRRSYARLERRYPAAEQFLQALQSVSADPAPPPAPAEKADKTCPNCHHPVNPEDQFCMFCGTQVVKQVRRCEKCGGYPAEPDEYCIFCGHGLKVAAP